MLDSTRGLKHVEETGVKPCLLYWWHRTTSCSSKHRLCRTASAWTAISGMLWIIASNFAVRGGLMGIWAILWAAEQSSSPKKKKDGCTLRQSEEMTDWKKRQREWSLPALYKYLMIRLEAGRVGWGEFGAAVTQTVGWWVSVMPLMLPHCRSSHKESLQMHQQHQAKGCWLASIKSIKNSCRQILASSNQERLGTCLPAYIQV